MAARTSAATPGNSVGSMSANHARRMATHYGASNGVVLQTRRIRRVSSRRLHHPRSEERLLVQQAHGEVVLRRSRLRHPATPWQVCLHQARRLWILGYCTHFKRQNYEREVRETRHRGQCGKHGDEQESVQGGRLHHSCSSTRCHGARGPCKFEGCTAKAISGSTHCNKHGGWKRKPCSVAGCTTSFQRKGLSSKHGGSPG